MIPQATNVIQLYRHGSSSAHKLHSYYALSTWHLLAERCLPVYSHQERSETPQIQMITQAKCCLLSDFKIECINALLVVQSTLVPNWQSVHLLSSCHESVWCLQRDRIHTQLIGIHLAQPKLDFIHFLKNYNMGLSSQYPSITTASTSARYHVPLRVCYRLQGLQRKTFIFIVFMN